jgi:hypothetical protein
MNSRYPSFQTGNGSTLRGLSESPSVMFDYDEIERDIGESIDENTAAVLQQAERYSPGIVQQAAGSSFNLDSLIKNIGDLAALVITSEAQRNLLNVNLQRAQNGLAPINPDSLAPTVNMGVSPATQQMIYILGGGLLVAMFLNSQKKGRR